MSGDIGSYRKLVNESLHIFLSLQKFSKDNDGKYFFNAQSTVLLSMKDFLGIPGSTLVSISRQYRSVLRDCQDHMDSKVDSAPDDEKEKSRDLSEILYKLELVWNLIEILFVEKNPCKFYHLISTCENCLYNRDFLTFRWNSFAPTHWLDKPTFPSVRANVPQRTFWCHL